MSNPRIRPAKKPRNQTFQWALLGMLTVIACVIAVVQFSGGTPSTAAARDVNAADTSSSSKSPARSKTTQAPDLAVTWPVKMHRDIFTWDHEVVQAKAEVIVGPDQQAIERQARETIKLQGIMLDGLPRIQANGRIVLLGGQIQGFTLKQIHHRQVIVTRNGVDVTLSM